MDQELIPRTTIVRIVAARDASIERMRRAVEMIQAGHDMVDEAAVIAREAHGAAVFALRDRSEDGAYRRLFQQFDPGASLDVWRKYVDARVWKNLVVLTGMGTLMDRKAKEDLEKDLCGDVPEVTVDNVRGILESLLSDANLIFQRGLARAFTHLDRRFKSHDGFKLGTRIILTNVFDSWGSWNYHSGMRDTMADIERVFAVLDGKKPEPGALTKAIEETRGRGYNPRQSYAETPYFRVRCFKNGNAHLWFRRDDLVEKANQVLADYYGEVLPDAAPRGDTADSLKTKAGLPAKNLSFYPTPSPVVGKILDRVRFSEGSRVLEPSAGTGHIVRHLLSQGAGQVDAVEIHPDRVSALEGINNPRLTVIPANFLNLPANPIYTHVVMNPPFYGTHWMEHVTHAFDFLAPGGTLGAVLPISADRGSTAKHKRFRAWAKSQKSRWGHLFTDLPPESFLESGTRINTVYMILHKSRQ